MLDDFFSWANILLSTQEKANQLDTHHRHNGGEAHYSVRKEHGCTSSQQRPQLGGVAPCADGLAWGFDEEGFDYEHNTKLTNQTPNKLGERTPPVNLLAEGRDTGKSVMTSPLPNAGSDRYVAYFAVFACWKKHLDS